MKQIILLLLISVISVLFITGCGPDFNTDFDPPPPEGKLEDIFPEVIDNMPAKLSRAKLQSPLVGFSAVYGENKVVINVIQLPDKATADDYFKEAIVPNIDKMKNHSRGKFNGKWRASGTDDTGRIWYGWVNNNWVFLINGVDKNHFKMAIESFKFIEE